MTRVFLFVATLAACSGSKHYSSGPSSMPQAKCSPCVEAAAGDENPSQSASKSEPSTIQYVPGQGFWCADFRKTPDDNEYLGACYRTKSKCDEIRKNGDDSGITVSSCESRSSAYCFTLADTTQHAMYWRCYKSTAHCSAQYRKHRDKHSELSLSECRTTVQRQSGGITRVARR